MKKHALILLCITLLSGCAAPQGTAAYQKISAEEAKKMLDGTAETVLVDVRTRDEFDQGHIPGAILLPNTDIRDKAAQELPDKNAVILVYCRSGNRSKTASQELIAMGYTQVYDFGGIIDWPYETVTE